MDSLDLVPFHDGIVLPVKAQAGAKQNGFRGIQDGRLKVCVTQVAEKGKANKAIIKLLAKSLGISASRIQLIAGELHSLKQFAIQGTSADELLERVRALIDK